MSKAKKVVISDELQSLINTSKASPAALVTRLFTDMLHRKYEAKAEQLYVQRSVLLSEILDCPARSRMVSELYKLGAEVNIVIGYEKFSSAYFSQNSGSLYNQFMQMSTNYPKRSYQGMQRIVSLSAYKTCKAFRLLMLGVDRPTPTSRTEAYDKALDSLGGMSVTHASVGLYRSNLVVRPIGYVYGKPSVTILLADLDKGLADKMNKLTDQEESLVRNMVSDCNLVIGNTTKLRDLTSLVKRLPDVLDHPDLKQMLGFDINPQADRIKRFSRVMGGDLE